MMRISYIDDDIINVRNKDKQWKYFLTNESVYFNFLKQLTKAFENFNQ